MRILIIGVVTLVLVLAIALTGFNTSTQSSEEGTNTQEVTLKVEGMTCGTCPLTIKAALKRLDGVVNANVSYEDKEAKVSYEEGKVTVDEIVKTIGDAGFKAIPLDKEGE